MRRRNFLLTLAGTAAAGLTGCSVQPKAGLRKISRSGFALGTTVQLTVFHLDRAVAEEALTAAFAELDRVEDVMSLYRGNSELSRLNATGRLAHPSPDLVQVLRTAAALSAQSEGAFDITVQPLWALYNEHARRGTQPDTDALRTVLQRVNWRLVDVSDEAIALRGEAQITLNGIAQGYAADRVAAVFRGHGIEHALIDTGEIGVVGNHAEKDHWSIGIKHPRKPGALLDLAVLRGRCLATSGDYESTFDEGFINHHLIDPHTGHSPSELASVSIVAPTALEADALSTAVFLMGPEKGRALVEATPGVDALFVTKAGATDMTPGFPCVA